MDSGASAHISPDAISLQGRILLAEQQRQVQQLAARDREVRAHEQAHASVGGAHAGAPSYEFTKGPNGVRYATSGHVDIDVGVVPGDPHATLKKMQTVVKAALAPAQPSAQDRAVAAKASQQAARALAEIASDQGDAISTIAQVRADAREVGSTAGGYIDLRL